MKAIEFKSKISNNRIIIPKKVQAELQGANEKNVRVMILLDDEVNQEHIEYQTHDHPIDLAGEELDSIQKGLTDFEEGKIHSQETARKIYGKYL